MTKLLQQYTKLTTYLLWAQDKTRIKCQSLYIMSCEMTHKHLCNTTVTNNDNGMICNQCQRPCCNKYNYNCPI